MQLDAEARTTLEGWIIDRNYVFHVIEFDSPEGQRFVQNNRILSIPTTLVAANGKILGRVEGYGGVKAFIEDIDAIASGNGLQGTVQTENSEVEIARQLILTGEISRGLEKAQHLWTNGTEAEKTAAVLLAARYYLRVARDFEKGVRILEQRREEMGTEVSTGVMYWLAQGYNRWKGPQRALKCLVNWEQTGGGTSAKRVRASFMERNGIHGPELSSLLLGLVAALPDDARVHYLLAKALLRNGEIKAAKESAMRALELVPDRAQYQRFVRELTYMESGI